MSAERSGDVSIGSNSWSGCIEVPLPVSAASYTYTEHTIFVLRGL